jgi:transcriptional regulator with XRE-family HTH domain
MGTSRRAPATYPDLASYISGTGDTQANIARRVGATQAHICRIARGQAVPRALLAARIAAYAGIPLESFTRRYLATHAGRVA